MQKYVHRSMIRMNMIQYFEAFAFLIDDIHVTECNVTQLMGYKTS